MPELASLFSDPTAKLQARAPVDGQWPRLYPYPEMGRAVRILGLPRNIEKSFVPEGAVECDPHEMPDVVVLTEPGAASLISSRLQFGCAAILPIIDAAPREGQFSLSRGSRFDLLSGASPGELGDALTLLSPIVKRLRNLPRAVRESKDPRMALLARIAVRDRGIVPRRDAAVLDTFSYTDESAVPGMLNHAEDLAEHGLLNRYFFDTLITCPRCSSGRVAVRERCASCQSSNLIEESILHHLRCTYQAPEHEFKDADGLWCPKCRARLVHFGVDYDRPGSVSLCRACGHASGESSVGFVCLDCEQESGADDMGTRTIHRYDVSEAGLECLRNGNALATTGGRNDSAAQRIRNFCAREAEANGPFCILAAVMSPPRGQTAGRLFTQTRALYASAMQETFTAGTETIAHELHFLALLSGDAKVDVERALPEIRVALEQHLSTSPPIRYRVYGPEEVQSLVETMLAL